MEKKNSSGNMDYTDLDMIDKNIGGFSIKDEYTHKMHVLEPKKPDIGVKTELSKLFSLITKDLALANIGDDYLKYIYQMHLRNAMNWFVAGLPELALIRMANLIGELQLERSREALERLLQAAAPLSGGIIFRERGEYRFLKRFPYRREEEQQQSGGGEE